MLSNMRLAIFVVACFCAGALDAAGIPSAIELQAKHLLQLNQDVLLGNKISVEQVFEAYKEYVHLYELQNDLAGKTSNDSGDGRYEAISAVLGTVGMDTVTDILFAPFNGAAPKEKLTGTQRANILQAIKETKS